MRNTPWLRVGDVTGHSLEIDASIDAVPAAGAAIRAICVREGLAELDSSMVELAVVEALTNAIVHGHSGQPASVSLRVVMDAASLRVEIEDAGAPVDPARVAPRVEPEPDPSDRASLREGGRGLPIIRGVFDEVTFSRQGSRNHLLLIKRRQEPRE